MIRTFLVCAALAVASAACTPAQASEVVVIVMRHSHFEPAQITVRGGVPITFILRNVDPIDHEWMIGDAAMHERHRTGTEPVHDTRPDEVTVPSGSERHTVLTFAASQTLLYICHLPGHERYGMVGELTIR